MNRFSLTVSTPDGNKFQGDVYKLDVRGTEGELAVMAGHVPFVTSLVKAPVSIWTDEEHKKEAVLDGGILTVDAKGATLIAGSFRFLTTTEQI